MTVLIFFSRLKNALEVLMGFRSLSSGGYGYGEF